MKNIIAVILISFLALNTYGQEEEMKPAKERNKESEKGGFKKDHLFTGGGIELSFANTSFVGGANPVIGYSINKWVDAGLGINFSYYSNRHVIYEVYQAGISTGQYIVSDDKERQTILGPIAFARVYPIKFLFVQAQGELNFISQKIIYPDATPNYKTNHTVPSLLVGAGYCSGRQGVGDLFYYISLSVDVLKNKNSPYVEQISNGKVNILPIIRAGLQIPLFQGKGKRDY